MLGCLQYAMGNNRKKLQNKYPSNHPLSHERGSEQSERASEQVSAEERASEASRAEQANEWAVRANKRTDERVAQYFRLGFWLIWPTEQFRKKFVLLLISRGKTTGVQMCQKTDYTLSQNQLGNSRPSERDSTLLYKKLFLCVRSSVPSSVYLSVHPLVNPSVILEKKVPREYIRCDYFIVTHSIIRRTNGRTRPLIVIRSCM